MAKKEKKRTVYRNKKTGRFVSAKKWEKSHGKGGKYVRSIVKVKKKPREITPPPKPPKPEPPSDTMWRVTIAAPYKTRCKGKKHKGSISASYMVRDWYKTEHEGREAVPELKKIARRGRKKVMAEKPWAITDGEVNVEDTRQVPYDERFLSIIEEKDEDPCNG